MTKPKTTPKTKAIDRKRISEALLADRLGLNEEWIERWEERSEIKEESHMPDRIPRFIRNNFKREIKDIEDEVERLVKAGCRRQVLHFCLAQLSPEATWLRAGREKEPVTVGNRHGSSSETDYFENRDRKLATREDLQSVANAAKATTRQIHRYQRELFLVAESSNYPLPVGFECRPKTAIEALDLLQDSLAWTARLAEAYSAPMETTLLKSKGLLYLTLYVSMFADSKKLYGTKISRLHRDSSRPSETVRARRKYVAGDPVTNLAAILGQDWKHDEGDEARAVKAWTFWDLNRKLADFKEDHPRLYEKLSVKLKELHNFAAQ